MQNRYVGDIGDFGKLGLLRVLNSNGLSIGVNWYLTDDESHNGDGRHVGYLAKTGYRDCDEALWYALKHIVASNQRETAAIERSGILTATYYSIPIDCACKNKAERLEQRKIWHMSALSTYRHRCGISRSRQRTDGSLCAGNSQDGQICESTRDCRLLQSGLKRHLLSTQSPNTGHRIRHATSQPAYSYQHPPRERTWPEIHIYIAEVLLFCDTTKE